LARALGILTKVLCDLPQSLQANAVIIPRIGHEYFLPNPFQLVIHRSSYHLTSHSLDTDSIIKGITYNNPQRDWEKPWYFSVRTATA
jgi:hypothetical protein